MWLFEVSYVFYLLLFDFMFDVFEVCVVGIVYGLIVILFIFNVMGKLFVDGECLDVVYW